jgi:murein DD-endopeptidase MepM/ murein hydrolase activator NlpD
MRAGVGILLAASSVTLVAAAHVAVTRDAAGLEVALAARAMQPGELVVLTITTPAPATVVTARAFGHHLATFQTDRLTWKALAGIDLDQPVGHYPVIVDATVQANRLEATAAIDVHAKAFPTRTLTVDEAFVNPPAAETTRIAAEAARLAKLWPIETPRRLWEGSWVRPVSDPANSAFGSRSVFNGQPRAPHGGADFLSPAGTPVHAPAGGTVVVAAPLYYTGNTVVIDHGLGVYSMFAHFSATDVREGDVVTAGQVIGRVGATGRVTGPHLHWAVRVSGARVDPLSLLAVLGASFDPRGFAPAGSPTPSLAGTPTAPLRSGGSLAPAPSFPSLAPRGFAPAGSPTPSLAGTPTAPLRSGGSLAPAPSFPSFAPRGFAPAGSPPPPAWARTRSSLPCS